MSDIRKSLPICLALASLRSVTVEIVAWIAILLLCACAGDLKREPSILSTLNSRLSANDLRDLDIRLSPNAQLIADDQITANQPVPLINLLSDRQYKLRVRPIELGDQQFVASWSPDSKNLAVLALKTHQRCSYDRVILYHLLENDALEYDVFYLPGGDKDCLLVTWSPDGKSLLISDLKGNIYLINENGELQRKFALGLQDVYFTHWTVFGLFATVGVYSETLKTTVSELWQINPVTGASDRLLKSDQAFSFASPDPLGKRLLLIAHPKYEPQVDGSWLWIFDLASREIQQKLFVSGNLSIPGQMPDRPLPWVAFVRLQKDVRDNQINVFYWDKLEIQEYGDIESLIGWRSSLNGFLTIKENQDGLTVDVVKP